MAGGVSVITLKHGRFEDVLRDAVVDAVIVDPPFSPRTHDGQRVDRYDDDAGDRGWVSSDGLGYEAWTPADVHRFVRSWSPRVRGWMVALTDHELIGAWQAAYRDAGRYAFHPLPCVIRGMTCRMRGDGPSSWAVYAVVARPRTAAFARWGTLRGAYGGSRERLARKGGKPLWLMRELVQDYTRPGDLVCDPCAGSGTTLLAAHLEGRPALGSEVDAEAYKAARARLQASGCLLAPEAATRLPASRLMIHPARPGQGALFDASED